jgi:hypothetical protein
MRGRRGWRRVGLCHSHEVLERLSQKVGLAHGELQSLAVENRHHDPWLGFPVPTLEPRREVRPVGVVHLTAWGDVEALL